MCGIWDLQSTIVKDLNDSQDPKHTLFCRKIAFVVIYSLLGVIFIGPRCLWGPIYGSGCLSLTETPCCRLN